MHKLELRSNTVAHIVVIDDSPTGVYVLKTMLMRHGYKVSAASNAEDGIALVKRVQPDVVLMDVIMPGMNGLQAALALNKGTDTSHIPVVIVTTEEQQTDKIWDSYQEIKYHLTKPVKEADLMALLSHF
jgi:twitching motility two-component system response regulator PilH